MATAKEILADAFEIVLAAKVGLEPTELKARHPNYKQYLLQRFYPFDLAKAQWACRTTTESELAKRSLRLLPQDVSGLVGGIRLDSTVDQNTTVMANYAVRAVPANFGPTALPATDLETDTLDVMNVPVPDAAPNLRELVLRAIEMSNNDIEDIRFDSVIANDVIQQFEQIEAKGPKTLGYRVYVAEEALRRLRAR